MSESPCMLPPASAHDILTLLEGFGLTGSWAWNFETGDQIWSRSLYRILGMDRTTQADYGLLYRLIHPDDRGGVMTPAELMRTEVLTEQTFRIVRIDGCVRTVVNRIETRFSAAGRPLRALGVLADVSDREALKRVQAVERRRSKALFETLRAFTSTTWVYPFKDFSEEFVELVGLPKPELVEEPCRPVLETERQHWYDYGTELYLTGRVVNVQPRLVLAGGDVVAYRMVMVPVLDERGRIESWSNFIAPVNLPLRAPRRVSEALERRIEEAHIRAGRALLDWSMNDLAMASGLSLSTVRRLEAGGSPRSTKSIKAAVDALRRNGIHFTLTDDSIIVLGKR